MLFFLLWGGSPNVNYQIRPAVIVTSDLDIIRPDLCKKKKKRLRPVYQWYHPMGTFLGYSRYSD